MTRRQQIEAGLNQLDHGNAEHWTSGGKPRIDVVRELSGVDDATRADVIRFAPDLMRLETVPEPVVIEPEKVTNRVAKTEGDIERPDAAVEGEEKQKLKAAIADIRQKTVEATAARDEAIRELSALSGQERLLTMAYQALFPAVKPQEAVMEYTARSREASERRARHAVHERHARRRSPLDEAMKDRRAFGTNRPDGFLLEKT